MKFSERYGYKKAREAIQIDSIDLTLRNSLWSILNVSVWDHVYRSATYGGAYLSIGNDEIRRLCRSLWFDYFKEPLDTLLDDWAMILSKLRKYFFECHWYELYDFMEFIVDHFPYTRRDEFIAACNVTLEKEASAYRFVDGLITKITDDSEIAEIDSALDKARGPVRTHLRRALELLSDRESPDYRNSIKESISGVESLVATVLGKKGTLGQLVKKLQDQIDIHPALAMAFEKLYGYTSDEDGIRHAILESQTVGFDEAKLFLVVCSAFVNFVESKIAATSGASIK